MVLFAVSLERFREIVIFKYEGQCISSTNIHYITVGPLNLCFKNQDSGLGLVQFACAPIVYDIERSHWKTYDKEVNSSVAPKTICLYSTRDTIPTVVRREISLDNIPLVNRIFVSPDSFSNDPYGCEHVKSTFKESFKGVFLLNNNRDTASHIYIASKMPIVFVLNRYLNA